MRQRMLRQHGSAGDRVCALTDGDAYPGDLWDECEEDIEVTSCAWCGYAITDEDPEFIRDGETAYCGHGCRNCHKSGVAHPSCFVE